MEIHFSDVSKHRRWAEFRLAVVGPLLVAPPAPGTLVQALKALTAKSWINPLTGQPASFSFATIERWYYLAKSEQSPIDKLTKKRRNDHGQNKIEGSELATILLDLYRQHPSWSHQLHYDNLLGLKEAAAGGAAFPSYSTVKRWMKKKGLRPLRGKKGQQGHASSLEKGLVCRETRSYEAPYPGSLWHLDFHHGRRRVLTNDGRWITPLLLAILDDRSRLICHLQWYEHETTDCLVHGFRQALQKRGVPRSLLTDNGSAMIAAEFTEGLTRLSILHATTLPYSPEQNGKQERFWGQLEGRLMAMLESMRELTLTGLNDASHAWVEKDYNRKIHSETKKTPLEIFIEEKDAHRPCPSSEHLSLCFTRSQIRKPRSFDGSISLAGKRFELPWQYRHLNKIMVRYRQWDLSCLWLMDEHGEKVICPLFPQDLQANFSGLRRETKMQAPIAEKSRDEMAPLLKKMMEEYAATGMPPAYLEKT